MTIQTRPGRAAPPSQVTTLVHNRQIEAAVISVQQSPAPCQPLSSPAASLITIAIAVLYRRPHSSISLPAAKCHIDRRLMKLSSKDSEDLLCTIYKDSKLSKKEMYATITDMLVGAVETVRAGPQLYTTYPPSLPRPAWQVPISF